MAMHDYRCEKCKHEEKDLISTGSLSHITCPKCGYVMKRLFPTTGHFKLNGDDWNKDGHALNKGEDVVKHE